MARDPRLNRQPSGPGRSTKKRPRAAAATASAGDLAPSAPAVADAPKRTRRLRRPLGHLGFTRRALVLFAVLGVLALSFAGSLRVYLVQRSELALAQQQIADRTARVESLALELERWDDPAYVKAQARTRLGWVMPGEVGYRVIDADGHVLNGSEDIEGVGSSERSDLEARWWDKLAGSVRVVDEPVAARR